MLKRIIRFFIPPWLQFRVMGFASRHPRLADLYMLVRGTFGREHQSVLYGNWLHQEQLKLANADGLRYQLRRNTHRLEKGLIMRPRRRIFALDYIGDTVKAYSKVVNDMDSNCEADLFLTQWTTDVLSAYFTAVGDAPEVAEHKKQYLLIVEQRRLNAGKWSPYHRDRNPLKTDFEAMLQLAERRRSVRWYLPKPVPRDVIDRAVKVAAYSPSACNRQPFVFHIIDDPAKAHEIGSFAGGTGGFAQNFPCLIAVVGQLRAYPSEADRHVIYIDASLASMSLLFALEVQGVATCCINWPDHAGPEKQIKQALNLDNDERVIMLISLGYPDPEGMVPYSQKKSLDEIRKYN